MKRASLWLIVWSGLLLLSAPVSAGRRPARKPNILFFLVDDLGWTDLAHAGSSFYDTPNLDRLASEGARFTQAYAACPVCSPTRASILTGRYPQRCRITDYLGAPQPETWQRNTRLLPAPYRTELALEEVTLAEALKESGYATFFAGKWHLGGEPFFPEKQGFDVNKGGNERGGPYGGNKYFSPYGNPRLEDGPPGEHLPDRLADETCNFMQKHLAATPNQPFLAYYAFYDVHTPLMARPDLLAKYQARLKERAVPEKWGREGERDVRLVHSHAVYAAMVEAMDQAVGKVLRKLDELGQRENTLVVFTSDNGGLSTSEGWPTSNQPLRAGKGWLYEGGIRVPLLMRWPGVISPDRKIGTPVISVDYFPTLLDAASGGVPASTRSASSRVRPDGISLLPLFQRKTTVHPRNLFWHYPHYGNQGGAPGSAILGEIRGERWKLIRWDEGPTRELYNLTEDPAEEHNLSALRPDLVRKLEEDLTIWLRDVGARYPTPNPRYDPKLPSGRAARRPQAAP